MGQSGQLNNGAQSDPGVVRLAPPAPSLSFDYEAIARIYAAEGPLAPQVIATAQDDLEHRLAALISARAEHDLDSMALSARRIRHHALQLGLAELRSVADALLQCCRVSDPIALSAVADRLVRLGRAAVSHVERLRVSVT